MMQVANQFRRIWTDDGRGDKDFSDRETKLRNALRKLEKATTLLREVSETLTDLIKTNGLPR